MSPAMPVVFDILCGMKVVVITGASRGLGLALAQVFSQRGWQVVGTGRSPRPERLPESVAYHQFDASDAAACESFWQQLSQQYQNVEPCLVNNAGNYISGGLVETTPEQYRQQMEGVYFSSVFMTRSLATHFAKARIINVISSGALAAHKNNSAYGAAKTAQMRFFQALQQEFTPNQYDITNLYPQNIATSGPNPQAIDPIDLAEYIAGLAELRGTYAVRDVTLYPQATPL